MDSLFYISGKTAVITLGNIVIAPAIAKALAACFLTGFLTGVVPTTKGGFLAYSRV